MSCQVYSNELIRYIDPSVRLGFHASSHSLQRLDRHLLSAIAAVISRLLYSHTDKRPHRIQGRSASPRNQIDYRQLPPLYGKKNRRQSIVCFSHNNGVIYDIFQRHLQTNCWMFIYCRLHLANSNTKCV